MTRFPEQSLNKAQKMTDDRGTPLDQASGDLCRQGWLRDQCNTMEFISCPEIHLFMTMACGRLAAGPQIVKNCACSAYNNYASTKGLTPWVILNLRERYRQLRSKRLNSWRLQLYANGDIFR